MIAKTLPNWMRYTAVMTAIVACAVSAPANAQTDESFKNEPGYVDFDAMKLFEGTESTVEVFLKGALLELAIQAMAHDEPELADALAGLKLVRVNIFEDYDRGADQRFRDKANEISKSLEKKGWDMAVRVRERDEQVLVYVLPGKNKDIAGLVVMAVEDRDEAVFLNIVGNIDPKDIGRLGHTFDIDTLEDFDYGERRRRHH